MKVFWSWQNDFQPKTNRHFIRQALADAIEGAGDDLNLEDADRPSLDHDTKGSPGMADITKEILDKISKSVVFVADVTPISKSIDGKAIPNPNVMIELGWAMAKVTPDRMIAVLNTASGCSPEDLPFDIRVRRVLRYELHEGAGKKERVAVRKGLEAELREALRTNLKTAVETKVQSTPITGVGASQNNPSIWAAYEGQIDYSNWNRVPAKLTISPGPRGYIRAIPADWSGKKPTVATMRNLSDNLRVWAPLGGGLSGDGGSFGLGYLWFWTKSLEPEDVTECQNAVVWFDSSGEFWIVHGSISMADAEGNPRLSIHYLLKEWGKILKSTNNFFDHFGASPIRLYEAGVVGLDRIGWPHPSESSGSRRPNAQFKLQSRDWSSEQQVEFLTGTFNEILDAYALEHTNVDTVRRIIGADR